MAAAIQQAFPGATVTLTPGRGGVFIVTADGSEIWNKRQMGRFPQDEEILDALAPGASPAPP